MVDYDSRTVVIPLKNGTKLAARLWSPVNADVRPVPALLEYPPYRKIAERMSEMRSHIPILLVMGTASISGQAVSLKGC
jgi:hypothetical protein